MGLEQMLLDPSSNTQQLAFDTKYSYFLPITNPYTPYSVSWYKNPPTGTYSGYTQKSTATAVKWNGQNYQQFWSTNYENAIWVTNGITDPFTATNIGMQFKPIVTTTIVAGGPPARVTLQITGHGLVVGDFVFVNEVVTTTGINFQTGYVDTRTDADNVIVTFPNATIATNGTLGIAQYLTNNSDSTKDCLRWYDGDPTSAIAPYQPAGTPTGLGWVNFCPPLLSGANSTFFISDLPAGQYYLVGARMILPFKDRLVFFGPVVQTSAGTPKYLPDTIIYSQNGTPYYTASFTGTPSATTTYTAILAPSNQSAQAPSFWEDQNGFGGFLEAGTQSQIVTAAPNEDVILVGFKNRQTRLIYTGNDIVPFNFYTINSELGSESTFSSIVLDRGVVSVGGRGIILTSQVGSQRIDLPIPDLLFQFSLESNGAERVCAHRDYINEWIVFTFRSNQNSPTIYPYPNQSLFYNYRDGSWAVFGESYTTYGLIRIQDGDTWATLPYASWDEWEDPWASGETTLLQPEPLGGNAQGFIMILSEGTAEGNSAYIKAFSSSQLTSAGHGLEVGDFILISGCLGTIGPQVNGKIFEVAAVVDADNFTIKPTLSSGTYTGLGVYKRLYPPYIQSKQFPVAWNLARKTRLGPQQYLMSTTTNGRVSLQIFLSQNANSPYNSEDEQNDALVYTGTLYTCPESTNLGLTAANVNLQMPTAPQQAQTWHRMNTSLLGDTVQIGITLTPDQLQEFDDVESSFAITGATQANPCVLTCAGAFDAGSMIAIEGVVGMTQLNFVGLPLNPNYYQVISSTSTTVTINVDSTSFGAYTSGGTAQKVEPLNQFSEIELHAFVLDVAPSQLLA